MTKMTFRPANDGDCRDLFEWRNDRLSRAMFFDASPVAFDQHARWFASRSASPDCALVIGETDDDRKVGVVRFDYEADTCEVSMNVNPACRGAGLAAPLLRGAIEFAAAGRPAGRLKALIKPENTRSIKVFSRCGFELQQRFPDRLVLVRNPKETT